jgi:hypothetical protein
MIKRKHSKSQSQNGLGDCLTCGEGTPATETVISVLGEVEPYCADCASQVRHFMKVSVNRRAGAKKAAATRRNKGSGI